MEITQALKECMAKAGWTPFQLSQAIGVREGLVRKWLAGTIPGGENLLKLQSSLPGFEALVKAEVARRAS